MVYNIGAQLLIIGNKFHNVKRDSIRYQCNITISYRLEWKRRLESQ